MAKYHRYTDEQHAFIVKHQADIPRKKLAELFNAEFGTEATTSMMNAYCRTRKLKSNSTGRFDIGGFRRENTHRYTQEQRDFIVKHQAFTTRKELAKRFNTRFGTALTKNQMVWYCHTHKLRRYNNTNPGSYVPIGSIHKGGKRQLHIKVCENGWMPLHRYNYIKAYGPIPDDHTIRFIDGDSFNCEPENLLAVPRSAQGAINSTKTYKTDNAELNKATMLTAALNTVVIRKSEEVNHGKT
ncbi:HNH endonuclease signature motif containing protein [uncultured Psychrobacter sp.]|uniref:HNH endonuclease signature motif containing protein n=1 Tax=uncultured Psychrobacter sp. TaxID=259303 RepID=UPI002621DA81|nr:HNH endonuclease signature motif containing protein [uncultured Psychrobacter sp.]